MSDNINEIEELEQENIEADEEHTDTSTESTEADSESHGKSDSKSHTEQVEDEPDTFPRDYVEKLRDENAKYRQRAQRADELAQRLHTALTAATGRLQDASDLPFDQSHIDDPEALETAISGLLESKPHLASRRPTGNIGQGANVTDTTVDLAGLLRSRA